MDVLRAWLVLYLVGCIEPATVHCGNKSCPVGDVCVASGCATPDAAAACADQLDAAPCTLNGAGGFCLGGACTPTLCGDGIQDPSEACDDHNTSAGDGCSGTCDSVEV